MVKFSAAASKNGSGVHPASYSICTGSFFLGSRVVGMWNWLLTPPLTKSSRMNGGTSPLHCMPLWHAREHLLHYIIHHIHKLQFFNPAFLQKSLI